MEIVDSHAEFEINIIGAHTKQTYMGKFKVKCLMSPMDVMECDKLYRSLIGSESPAFATDRTKNLAFALSQLKYRIVDYSNCPFWGNKVLPGSHIPDDNVIIEIVNLAIEAEDKYLESKEKESKELEKRLKKAFENKDIQKEPEPEESDS